MVTYIFVYNYNSVNVLVHYNYSQPQVLFCACVNCHTAIPAQRSVEQLSYDGGPSPHVPSLKIPAVSSVDLSAIPEGTLGEWLCKHTMMSCNIE